MNEDLIVYIVGCVCQPVENILEDCPSLQNTRIYTLMASRTSLFPKSVLRCISGRETCNFSQRRSIVSGKSGYVKVSEEVREAIDRQRPVVALETTIYTHG